MDELLKKQITYTIQKLDKVEIKGILSGAELKHPGGTFQERTEAMIRLKNEIRNRR